MADAIIAQADRAFVEEEYAKAIELYSTALETVPNNARVWESRAHAHIKAEDYLEAVNDAAKAIELDPGMAKAHLRRGVALFNLDEYEAARAAFDQAQQLDPAGTQYVRWIRKCQAELDGEPTTSAPAAAASAAAPAPAPAAPSAAPPTANGAPSSAAPTTAAPSPGPSSGAAGAAAQQAAAPAAPAPFEGKYRHQYYQLQNKVTVDIYAKNIPADSVSVDFQPTHLTVTLRDAQGEEEYKLDAELYGKIDPASSKFEVLRSKIEVTMVKADPIQWGSLEKSSKVAAPNYSTPGTTAPAQYPTSHTKAKNWSEVDAELAELEKKGELDDGDPLNSFFKKIFSQGDEDTRRAMMKSFVESNGTVLSTNWSDVGSKKVECTPPDGMVTKKWEQ